MLPKIRADYQKQLFHKKVVSYKVNTFYRNKKIAGDNFCRIFIIISNYFLQNLGSAIITRRTNNIYKIILFLITLIFYP